MNLGKLSLSLCIFLLAFAPVEEKGVLYYYSLQFLKTASPPQRTTLIKVDATPMAAEGVLFTYKHRMARKVAIAGDFSHWRTVSMSRSDHGVWHYFQATPPGVGKLRYKFMVDGIWTPDPLNTCGEDDRAGSSVSVFEFTQFSEGKRVTYRLLGGNRVEFRIYRPEASMISLVGDFNNWNPEQDLLTRGADGIWRLRKALPGGTYRYKYIIDGDWTPDLYNTESSTDPGGSVCSLVKVR